MSSGTDVFWFRPAAATHRGGSGSVRLVRRRMGSRGRADADLVAAKVGGVEGCGSQPETNRLPDDGGQPRSKAVIELGTLRAKGREFAGAFDELFCSDRATIIRTTPYTPFASPCAERCVGTIRRELCDRSLIRTHEQLLREYLEHLQRAPIPPHPRPMRTERRKRLSSIGPADHPTTPHVPRTHHRVPPTSLNSPQRSTRHGATSDSTRLLPDHMPRRRRPRCPRVRTGFRRRHAAG